MNPLVTWIRRRLPVVAVAVAVASFGVCSAPVAMAQMRGPCSSEGAWLGVADNGFRWLNIITPGGGNGGQVDLAWVIVDPTLGGAFPNGARVTSGRGVWKHSRRCDARWTWVAYGLDDVGAPAYVIRASGTHHMPNANHLEIVYALEIFLPTQDMAVDPPIAVLHGTALETRLPLVKPPSGP